MVSWIRLGICACVLGAVACSDSSSGNGGGGKVDSGPGADAAPAEKEGTAADAGLPDAQGSCGTRLSALTSACAQCALAECSIQLAACCDVSTADAGGCVAVTACAIRTRCAHAACYEAATCKAEIDGAGGITGAGTPKAGELAACMQAASTTNGDCRSCFEGK